MNRIKSFGEEKVKELKGAFIGTSCSPTIVSVNSTTSRIHYIIQSQVNCKLVLENAETNQKVELMMYADNKWHHDVITVEKVSKYSVYLVCEENTDVVQYQIMLCDN